MIKKLIKRYRNFRCYVGLHNWHKGMFWAVNMRCDVCTNNCYNWTLKNGIKRTQRWVEDVKGSKLYFFKRNVKKERRKVLFEKCNTSPD